MAVKNWRSKVKTNLAILAVMVLLCLLVTAIVAWASGPEPTAVDEPANSRGWGDDGILEVGVEWINDFPGTSGDRSHWDESCDGLYYDLLDEGWTGRFRWTNWGAYEKDWKRGALGGWENSYPDNVDIAMLCTHGSSAWASCWSKTLSSVYFGSSVDDQHLTPCDAYQTYGDKDAEWIAFDSCSVLRDDSRAYWAASMNGLHQLLGFANTMYVISYGDGKRWAEYMQGIRWCIFGSCFWVRSPYKVAQAWFETTDDLQPGGVCARVLAEENYHFNDYLWGKGSVGADYVDGDYYWQTHCSCTPPPTRLAPDLLAQIETMPVIEVQDRVVDEEYVLGIASVFPELEGGSIYSDTAYYYMINVTEVATYSLQVDMATGGYKFRNMTDLWASPVETPTLPLEGDALALGEEFLGAGGPGEALPAAAYRTGGHLFYVEEQVESGKGDAGTGNRQEDQRVPVQASLSYGRDIPIQVVTSIGTLQETNVSVVGPGGRMKLYFGDLNEILGLQGGSRDIAYTGEQVTIMDATKAWDLYLADPTIALAQIPWDADTIEKTGETLGYYEQPHLQGQSQMIPTWIFSATFSLEGTILAEDVLVYVPASADYMPPDVTITAPTEGAVFSPGQLVTFEGTVVGENGMPPFTYDWYSSNDGFLGSGSSIQAPLSTALGKGEVSNHVISLEVTDANGQKRTATVNVLVKQAVYLPLIMKNQ